MYRRAAFIIGLVFVAGCGGGGSAPPPFNTGNPLPTSVTQTQSIGPAGGSVTATLGQNAVTVNVPAGALAATTAVSLTVYTSGASPRALHGNTRSTRSIGADGVLLVPFSVATNPATTLIKPLQASLVTPAAAAGSVFRLAGFGSPGADDVDTVSWANGTATSDLNKLFPRMSLAAAPPGTLYAFYVEPAAEATGPATPVVAVSTGAQPIGMFGSATFTASEASPTDGFPYLDPTFQFTTDSPLLGTINASTGQFTATALDGVGNAIATDTTSGRGNPHGSAPFTVTSQRPGNVGDSFTFSGMLSSTTQQTNSNITTAPQTDTAQVAITATSTAAQAVTAPVVGTGVLIHSNETDTYPLQTIKTGTDNVYGYVPISAGHDNYIIGQSTATDSNGAQYQTSYDVAHGNGILDVLPETAGAFGPNTAALTYNETDPANFSRSRTVNADGSYVENGRDPFGDVQTITVNSDLSGSYDARQYSGYRFTMSAPTGSPARIIYRIFNASGTQLAAYNLPSWIPSSMTQPSTETDVTSVHQTFPGACSVPAKYGTSGNQIVQTINRADPALGNLETQTTTTYTAGTAGPVCILMSDSIQTFYDYTLQNGFVVYVSGNAKPVQLTSLSETLTLQSAKTSGGTITQTVARGTSSASRSTSSIAPAAFAPAAFARARFEHAVREKLGGMRKATFNRNFMSQGVQVL